MDRYTVNSTYLLTPVTASGPTLRNVAASATVPCFVAQGDNDTGLGHAAADAVSLIAGGVEGLRITELLGTNVLDVYGDTDHNANNITKPATSLKALIAVSKTTELSARSIPSKSSSDGHGAM